MDAAAVAQLVESLRARGCSKVRATFDGAGVDSIEVEFAPVPVPVTPFVDKEGAPVNLDDGAGPLTKDPDDDAPAPRLESDDAALEHANFHKKRKAA